MYDRNHGTCTVQMITVNRYTPDLKSDMEQFIKDIRQYDLFNWSSFERLKTEKITYFLAYYNNKIISINGCYNFRDNDWCLFTRQFTIPKYYNLLKREKHLWSKSIPSRFLATPSLDYCLDNGAEGIYFYVNAEVEDGDNNWYNGNYPTRHADLMVSMGVASYKGIDKINNVYQDVYKINVPRIREVIGDLLNCPLRFNDEIK